MCTTCGVDLRHPAVDALRELDSERAALDRRHAELRDALRATAGPPDTFAAAAATPDTGLGVAGVPPPPGAAATPAAPGDTAPAGRGVATLLAFAGVSLLTAAAAVFAAVVWTVLSPAAQALLLVVATAAAITVALLLDRRNLHTTAGAVGVVAMAFAAADVAGLDRSGLLPLGEATTTAASGVAAILGLVLARTGLRWVSTAGALAAAVAASVGAGTVIDAVTAQDWTHPLIAAGFGLVLAATTTAWPSRPGRTVTWLAAGMLVTTGAIIGAVGLGDTATGVVFALVGAVVPVALLVVAATRTPWSLAPAALLASVLPVVLTGRYTDEGWILATVGAWTAVALAWLAVTVSGRHRTPLLAGSAPALLTTAVVALVVTGQALARLLTVASRSESRTLGATFDVDVAPWLALEPWAAAVAVAAGVAALAWPPIRRGSSWIVGWVVAVSAATLPVLAAGVILTVTSLVGLVATELRRRRTTALHVDPVVVVLLALAGLAWLSSVPPALAVSAGMAAAVSWRVGCLATGARRVVAGLVAVTAASAAAVGISETFGAPFEVTLAAGLVTALAAAALAQLTTLDAPARTTPWAAGVVTAVVVLAADTDGSRGAMLLLAAAGWTVMAVTGRRGLRWPAALLAAAGTTTLQSSAGVETLEAYTAVWAVALALAGLWRLIEVPASATLPMLWPAAAVGLLPSMVALADDPRVLTRAVVLAAVGVALAFAGVQLRWKAPLIAGVAAASWVGLTQVLLVVAAMPGWIAFGVLGTVLVALAATYEHHQRQLRRFRGWLTELR